MKHLWEVTHPYYCNEGAYFCRADEVHDHHKSWTDFMAEYEGVDLAYNLIFRYDWTEKHPDTEQETYNGDDYYRNGKLSIFWIAQRKGYYRWTTVEVCRADEVSVKEFLARAHDHLKRLWEPFS